MDEKIENKLKNARDNMRISLRSLDGVILPMSASIALLEIIRIAQNTYSDLQANINQTRIEL